MTKSSRSRPDSSPPALGPIARRILQLGGAAIVVLAVALFVLASVQSIATPAQALAVGLIGLSVAAFGVGTGHEFDMSTTRLWPIQHLPHGSGQVDLGSTHARHARVGAPA